VKLDAVPRTSHWPDADMLPVGILQMGKSKTYFTRDEQIINGMARTFIAFRASDDDLTLLNHHARISKNNPAGPKFG
jgi:hypothetical protein